MTPAWTEHGILETDCLQLWVSLTSLGWRWGLHADPRQVPMTSGPPWGVGGYATEAEAKDAAIDGAAAWLEARAAELRAVGGYLMRDLLEILR
jgi:hypothetical protein